MRGEETSVLREFGDGVEFFAVRSRKVETENLASDIMFFLRFCDENNMIDCISSKVFQKPANRS